ncbi:HlyD family efflux transporter periplasmic adaptor subunit [Paenibacillus septentrionalis]|uniref:HlyD family efflux transporter periplasmic adaptor subunit n=1 Tax=Paenibacillus septentrionalis TaxID=429342 RepID=A0ABW1V6G1_9BACL
MRAVIREMSEMTDSREILEARTHPAITTFIAILLLLIGVGLIWSFIGEIDEVAKASGIVRPNDKVSNIQTLVSGTVESLHVQEGQWVEEGDLLIKLEHESLQLDLSSKQTELAKLERENEYLKRYRDSVYGHHNLFVQKLEEETIYYSLVEQYLLEYSQKELDYNASVNQLDQAKNESLLTREGIVLNQKASNQKNERTKADYNRQIEQLEKELHAEKMLKQSMEAESDQFSVHDPLRIERFNQYILSLNKLKTDVSESEKKLAQSVALGERFVPKSQLDEEQAQIELAKLQLTQFQQEAILGVQAQITDYENQLKEIRQLAAQLEGEESSTAMEQQSFQLEEEKLSDQYRNLQKQSDSIQLKSKIDLDKFRLDRIVQIEAAIEEKEKSSKMLLDQINQLQISIDKQSIYAPISGMVHMIKDMNVGDIVQPGESLLSVIPVNESMYKMSIVVPNHEIGQIDVGQQVDMNFHAFPKQSFGSLIGTVNSISSDSIIQQDGRSYYTVEASIANKPLVNRKGESGEIRVGMTAEAYVITDSKKIIHYLLEKINLRD